MQSVIRPFSSKAPITGFQPDGYNTGKQPVKPSTSHTLTGQLFPTLDPSRTTLYRTAIVKDDLAQVMIDEVVFVYEDSEFRVMSPYGFPLIKMDDGVNYRVHYNGISTSTDITRNNQLVEVECSSEGEGLYLMAERRRAITLHQQTFDTDTPPPRHRFNLYSADIQQLLRDGGHLNNEDVRAYAVPNPTPEDPQHVLLVLGAGSNGNDIPSRQMSAFDHSLVIRTSSNVNAAHNAVREALLAYQNNTYETTPDTILCGYLTPLMSSLPNWRWSRLVEFVGKGGAGALPAMEAHAQQGGKPVTPELRALATILERELQSAVDSPEWLMQVDRYMARLGAAPSLHACYLSLDGRDRMILRLILTHYNEIIDPDGPYYAREEAAFWTANRSLDSFESESPYAYMQTPA